MFYLKTKFRLLVNRPRTSVHCIIKYKEQKSVDNKPRYGQPKKFSEVAERWLVRQIKKEPETSASNLAKVTKICLDIDVMPKTVGKYLHSNGFKVGTSRNKP
ncbi:hypothetical protein TNCT_205121 [Trichonephila clavata]|uniref:Transposase n=1 Tax=Trichonephila clavata TaxID=2740835 RepID=A0A8X6FF76_TRICU|nr:hypothetical protein TNCT_205121 [Trichonephila clavata]